MNHLQHLQWKMSKTKKKLFDPGPAAFAAFLPFFALSVLLIASMRLFQDTGSYGYVQGELPILSSALDSLLQEAHTQPVKMGGNTLAIEQTSTTLSIGSLEEIGTGQQGHLHTVPYTPSSMRDDLQRLLAQMPPSSSSETMQHLIVLVPAADQPVAQVMQLMAQLRQDHHYAHILLAYHPTGAGTIK